jgi:hypothetical protein
MKVMLIALLIAFVQSLPAQQSEPSAYLEGTVMNASRDEPLARATVELQAATSAAVVATTMTDDSGRFFFPNVSPAQYRLSATRRGYIRAEYGQHRVDGPGMAIGVSPGQRLPLRLEMTPGGSISGRVTDRGLPTGGAVRVFAVKASMEAGQRMWKDVLFAFANDLGEYHLSWLPPGRYYVMAIVPDGPVIGGLRWLSSTLTEPAVRMRLRAVFVRNLGTGTSDTDMHVPVFYPNTPDWKSATPVDLLPGGEVVNVDIDASPRPALHVRGMVTGLTPLSVTNIAARGGRGSTVSAFRVALLPLDDVFSNVIESVQTDEQGAFEIARVPPGSYVVVATGANNGEARTTVEVRDKDVNGIVLGPTQQISVSGRITIEGQKTASDITSRLRVGLVRAPLPSAWVTTPNPPLGVPPAQLFSLSVATPTTAGVFSIQRPSGDYRVFVGPLLTLPLSLGLPAPNLPAALKPPAVRSPEFEKLYVKSIRLGDTDVLADGLRLPLQDSQPMEIVIGSNPGAIEGRVVDARNQTSAATTVVVIPESGARFYTNHKYAVTDASGRFQIADVPPGDYKIFAWESVESRAWQDPDFVRQYEAQGTSVRVVEGRNSAIELMSIP